MLCYVIVVSINYVALIKTAKVRINLLSVFIKPVFSGILCGVAAYTSYGIFNRFLPEFSIKNLFCLAAAIGFGGIVYVISILLIKGIAKDDVIMLPKGEKIAKILAKFGFIG